MSGSEPTPSADPQEWYCATCDRSFGAGTAFCPEDGTRLVQLSDRDPLIGREIDGRFVIRERLGQGGMGVVYRAWQASVGREVAIKVIRPRPGHDATTTKRFLREAKLASQLSQPSTVSVIDFGQGDDNILYLVMELIRGRTLADVLRDHGRMSPERVVRIGTQICDALEAAHRLGIIHRDLKPANVMILDDPPGRDLIKVLDFGLAKVINSDESTVTQSGRLVGTPSHLPPEVAMGSAASPKSDLYAVGVMLFEMLDGRQPFTADNVNMMVALHAYQPAPELGPHVPAAMAQLVARTLAKNPDARPSSAASLRALLDAAMRGELPSGSGPIMVTADSDEQRRLPISHTIANRSPAALAETLRKPKTRPPLPKDGVVFSATAAAADSTAVPAPVTTAEAVGALRRRRWPLLVLLFALTGGALAIAVAKLGAGPRTPTAGAPALGAPLDAAAAARGPADAAVESVGAPLDAPVDAAAAAAPPDARLPPLDAGRRHATDDRRPRVDAAAGSAPPPPPPPPPPRIDAGPAHPWDDP